MADNPGFQPFPAQALGGLQIIEVPLSRVEVQVKRHKRKSSRRWQKKWLKRFGTRTEYHRMFKPGEVILDEIHGIVYAHPEEARNMKYQSMYGG